MVLLWGSEIFKFIFGVLMRMLARGSGGWGGEGFVNFIVLVRYSWVFVVFVV